MMTVGLLFLLSAILAGCTPGDLQSNPGDDPVAGEEQDGDGGGHDGNGGGHHQGSAVDEPPPCGAPGATLFDIYVDDVLVLPYKQNGEPWDWNGQVPRDLLESVDLVSAVIQDLISAGLYPPDPTALTAAELIEISDQLLDVVDTYAPRLLAETVPPDLYVDLLLEDANADWWTYGASDYVSDSFYAPIHAGWGEVDLRWGEVLVFALYDSDLVVDDEVGGPWLDLAGAQALADCGPLTWVSEDPRYPVQVVQFEIVAVE